tara:strand:- start:1681 stop:2067 length:387 start_codon:yes stop_codon:yes gene_type:complete
MNTIDLEKKIKHIDKKLSKRNINLDPNGYFLIKVDLMHKKIIVEHYLNKINNKGIAIDPDTNMPITCREDNIRQYNKIFIGESAKEVGILLSEKDEDLISKIDHALYLGRELQKAEECIMKNIEYIQD